MENNIIATQKQYKKFLFNRRSAESAPRHGPIDKRNGSGIRTGHGRYGYMMYK